MGVCHVCVLSPFVCLCVCVCVRRDFGLTTAMKLTARFPAQVPRLQALMSKGLRSPALEPQTRSAEYTRMFKLDANVRAQVRV